MWLTLYGALASGTQGPSWVGDTSSLDAYRIRLPPMVGAMGVGMASAIAIPNVVAMKLRAKRAEVPSRVQGIAHAARATEDARPRIEALAPQRLGALEGLGLLGGPIVFGDRLDRGAAHPRDLLD